MKTPRLIIALFALAGALAAPLPARADHPPMADQPSEKVFEHHRGRTSFGSDVLIRSGESVRDLAVFFGNATVEGQVEKDAVVIGGNLLVRNGGQIGKDAVVIGGSLHCEEDGRIGKDRVVLGGGSILKKLAAGGLLAGLLGSTAGLLFGLHLAASLAKFAVLLVLGILCLTFLALPTRRLTCVRPFRSLCCGLLLILLFVPLVLLLLISIIGIPLIPLLALAYLAAIAFGVIAAAFSLGGRVAEKFFHSQSPFLGLLLGLVLLHVLTWIPILGWLICLALICYALGAAWLTRFGSRDPAPACSTAAPGNGIGNGVEEVRS